MPTPHVFVAALCVGIALANAWRPGVVVALAGALAFGGVAARSHGVGRVAVTAVALGAAGAAWGSARLDALDRSLLEGHIGRAERSLVVTTGPVRRTPFGLRVPARVERFGALWVDEAVLLELPLGRAPPQGSRLDLVAVVERPRQSSEGFDERDWLRRKGVHVVIRGRRWVIVGRRGGILGVADRLHARLDATIAPGLDGERRAILRGVVLGEDEGLTRELRDAFRASGLYHLLAVSGQNVALLVGGVLALAWLLGIPRLPAQVGALVAIAAYVLAVGWQPSVVRAGVAGGLASLAWLTARQRDRWWFLLVGALVLLAWNPYAALEPGFQLSFGAVAAIFVAVPRFARLFEGYPMPSSLRDVLAVSSACGLATAPIAWLHFGAVPLYTVPANALAAPVVGSLLGLGLIAAALHPFAPGAAALVAWANGWCASYLAACARAVASLPSAQLGSTRSLLVVGGLLALPLVWPRLHRPRAARAAVLVVMVLAANVAWRDAPQAAGPPPDGLRMTFL
ncbi:MAG TPA: ComEC/Rec2 family competence protein, partial [Gaiellaceae bacterium]|nr:ComEC/Rec2 family competence protein [Gaiellaceae bacterium]